MRKIGLILILFIICVMPVYADQVLDQADYGSLSALLDAVPENAGDVSVILRNTPTEADQMLEIPADRGVTQISFVLSDGVESLNMNGINRICANGVPLTIEAGLVMPDTSVYGGACVSGTETTLDSSRLTIDGTVGFVFGGGFAEDGGFSAVTETSVTVTESGLVYYEVFGGGHAYGENGRVFSEKTFIEMNGTADYVLAGGFAEDGGQSDVTMAEMTVGENGHVPVALFTGGSASGNGSLSLVENVKAIASGEIGWAFSGDFAFSGGETRTTQASRLELLAPASAAAAYLGSFSSDEGSYALINTSELMSCGTVEQIIRGSQSTDQGKAETQIPALFPCTDN